MQAQDLYIALALAANPERDRRQAALAQDLGLTQSQVHYALARLKEAGLVNRERKVMKRALKEFVVHGLKYVFPAKPGAMSLGVATGPAAPALADEFPPVDPPWVWPSPRGDVRGLLIEPLFKAAPDVAKREPKLYELLALVDALRAGRARDKALATARLKDALA